MGLSIAGAARLAGIPRAYLSMIESDKRSPTAPVLYRLMTSLEIPATEWLPAYLEDETRCPHMIRMARALFDEGRLHEARRILAKAYFVSRDGYDGRHNADIYYLLGRVNYGLNRVDRASWWFQRMERATRHAPLSSLQGVASYNLAQAWGRTGKHLEALRMFDQAIENFARFQRRKELGMAWLAKANVLLRMRLYKEAFEAYHRASHFLRRTSLRGDALLGEAITIAVLQGAEEARPLFESIAANTFERSIVVVKARANLGAVLRQLGAYGAAIQNLLIALDLREEVPASVVAALLSELTICHLYGQNRAAARESFHQYKEITAPKDSEDIAAMNIVAGILGETPPDDPIPTVVEDDFEQRVKAALELLMRYRLSPKA